MFAFVELRRDSLSLVGPSNEMRLTRGVAVAKLRTKNGAGFVRRCPQCGLILYIYEGRSRKRVRRLGGWETIELDSLSS